MSDDLRPVNWFLIGRKVTIIAIAVGVAGYLAGKWLDSKTRADWLAGGGV